jgi:pyruvate dehydrogenase (quinone)
VAVVGDGGLSMSIAELATCVRYRLPVKVVVLNNSSLAQIKWEQMLFLGNPEFGCALQPVDFAVVAEGFGVRGVRLEDPALCEATLADALKHDGPVLVDALVDANEPMLPPKRRESYVKNLAKALEQGTPGREQIERALTEEPAVTSLRD